MYHFDYYILNFGIRSEIFLTLYLQFPVSTKFLRSLQEMSFLNFHSLLILLIIEISVSPINATTCFKYQNQIGLSGTAEAIDHAPCDPNASVSACCHWGIYCISNLHCYNPNLKNHNIPGSCTDQSFRNPACLCPPSRHSCRFAVSSQLTDTVFSRSQPQPPRPSSSTNRT